jgi:hypothetical protein
MSPTFEPTKVAADVEAEEPVAAAEAETNNTNHMAEMVMATDVAVDKAAVAVLVKVLAVAEELIMLR